MLSRNPNYKKQTIAGIFDEACLHRVGFHALDAVAHKGDIEKGELLYKVMHDSKEKGGLGLVWDASHFEKIILAHYNAKSYSGVIKEFERAEYNPTMPKGWEGTLKTQACLFMCF